MFNLNTLVKYAEENNIDFEKEIMVKLVGTDCDDETRFAIHVAHSPEGQLGIIVKSLSPEKPSVATIRIIDG